MFRYEIVSTSSSRFDVWRGLRTELYLAADLIAPDDLDPSGTYTDRYDEYSIHVLATDSDGAPVGCCRLIEGNLGPLQVTEQFGVSPEPASFEVSGCASVVGYRRSFLTLGLYRAMHALAVEIGYERSYMEVEEPFLDSLLTLGLPLQVIGQPRYVYNAYNVVATLAIAEVVPALRAADASRGSATRIGDYFDNPFAWSLTEADVVVGASAGPVPDAV